MKSVTECCFSRQHMIPLTYQIIEYFFSDFYHNLMVTRIIGDENNKALSVQTGSKARLSLAP